MWLFVGLGNPGSKYSLTRHNIGFMALDRLGSSVGLRWQEQHKGLLAKTDIHDHDVILLKPQTFMNLSGQSVQSVMSFYKIPQDHLIVFHDDVDQPFESIRIHKNRGHGGHNGIRDISQLLGSPDYIRIKMGVGRPAHPDFSVADYVLQNFSSDELTALPNFLEKSLDAAEAILKYGVDKATNEFNKRTEDKPK